MTEKPISDLRRRMLEDMAVRRLGGNTQDDYINYVETNTALARYLGPNLVRFNAIRQQFDPGGLMRSGIS